MIPQLRSVHRCYCDSRANRVGVWDKIQKLQGEKGENWGLGKGMGWMKIPSNPNHAKILILSWLKVPFHMKESLQNPNLMNDLPKK